jgi:hypothetical protein
MIGPGDHSVVPSIWYDLVTALRPYSLHLFVLLQNPELADPKKQRALWSELGSR